MIQKIKQWESNSLNWHVDRSTAAVVERAIKKAPKGSLFVVSTVDKVEKVSKTGALKMTYQQEMHQFENNQTRPHGIPGQVEFSKWRDPVAFELKPHGLYVGRSSTIQRDIIYDVPIVNPNAPRGLSIFQEAYAY